MFRKKYFFFEIPSHYSFLLFHSLKSHLLKCESENFYPLISAFLWGCLEKEISKVAALIKTISSNDLLAYYSHCTLTKISLTLSDGEVYKILKTKMLIDQILTWRNQNQKSTKIERLQWYGTHRKMVSNLPQSIHISHVSIYPSIILTSPINCSFSLVGG